MTEAQFPVSKKLGSIHKAVTATVTSALGMLTLFGTAIGDGSVSAAETGTLVTAGITTAVTVIGVWMAPYRHIKR